MPQRMFIHIVITLKLQSKNLDTLVEDIYSKLAPLSNGGALDLDDSLIEEFGESIKKALKTWAIPQRGGKTMLRMSNIGKPMRQLWFDLKNNKEEETSVSSYLPIKFLYGHLLEEVLLFLVRLSEHKVEDEQKEVKVSGIKGHIDCKIDGEVVDIKTASSYAFKKFKAGTLRDDDPFGYMAQLAGYEESEKTDGGGFLVINKETGELTLYRPEELDKPNVKIRIRDIKDSLMLDTPPKEYCYDPVSEGKSGNMKLPRECTYCKHKVSCYPDLRAFQYSKGLVYLTEVVNEPRVEEVYDY